MRKKFPTELITAALIIALIVVAVIYIGRPYLKCASVINLDGSTSRWTDMQPELAHIPVPTRRWSATDGRVMSEDDFKAAGIPNLLRPSYAREDLQKKRKGEIGCYLSHKRVIEDLGKQWALPNAAHLILEDDVTISENFAQDLSKSIRDLPADWDILYVGLIEKGLQMDAPTGHVARVRKGWGTYGYIIRHGSIPKILREIRIMFDPIDDMLYESDLNLYAARPFSVHQREDVKSEIHG